MQWFIIVLMITGLISWRWQTALWSVFHSILQRKRLDHGCSYVCCSTALFDSFMTQVLQEVCRVAQASGQSRGLSQVHIDNSRRQYAHTAHKQVMTTVCMNNQWTTSPKKIAPRCMRYLNRCCMSTVVISVSYWGQFEQVIFPTVLWINCRIMESTNLSTTSEAYRYYLHCLLCYNLDYIDF